MGNNGQLNLFGSSDLLFLLARVNRILDCRTGIGTRGKWGGTPSSLRCLLALNGS